MSLQQHAPGRQIGLFLNPVGQRRIDFQALCTACFDKLFIADGTEQATLLLSQQQVDLLIIDLDGFDYSFDLDQLGQLIGLRAGARTLVLCPFSGAGWLPDLMDFGPLEYAITPMPDPELRALVAQAPPAAPGAPEQVQELRTLIDTGVRLQDAISDAEEFDRMAGQICTALASVPGVAHAALFHVNELGDLVLAAQQSNTGLNLTRIIFRTDRLMQSPLRNIFPGLLAAAGGNMALLDAPARAGEPELARTLAECGIQMVLGLPLPAGRSGAPRGALCLMFGQARQFSRDELDAFVSLAQLAGFGLRTAEICRENEQLLARVTHLATTDALTGAANRRHGEHLLDLEARRARRYKLPVALIVFDIDRFKAINDQYGHPVGDAVIRTVADATQAGLRNSDVLVRSGGEEFQIIAPHTSAIDALKIAEKLRQMIAQTEIPGCDRVTISLGVGQLSEQESPDALLVRVDAALARAKRAGRNCVELAMQ